MKVINSNSVTVVTLTRDRYRVVKSGAVVNLLESTNQVRINGLPLTAKCDNYEYKNDRICFGSNRGSYLRDESFVCPSLVRGGYESGFGFIFEIFIRYPGIGDHDQGEGT